MQDSLPGPLLHGLLLAGSLAITLLLRQPPGDGGGSGGQGRQVGTQPPAGSWQPWGERGRFIRHHQIIAGLFAAVAQALTSVFKSDHSAEAVTAFLQAEAAILVFLVGIPALASEAWLARNHLLYNFACRVAWANTGNDQQHGVGHALQSEPATGRLRLLKGVWQLFLGTKSFALLGLAIILPLPMLPHLLLAVAEYRTLTDVRWACRAPMLRHPVWQGWIQSARALLDNTLMALAYRGAAAADGEQDCRTFVTLFQLVFGIVIPALIGQKVLEASSWGRSNRWLRQRPGSRTGGSGSGGSGGSSTGGSNGTGSMRTARALDAIRLAAVRVETVLHWVCDQLQPRFDLLLPLAWALLLQLLWTVALVLQWPTHVGTCSAG